MTHVWAIAYLGRGLLNDVTDCDWCITNDEIFARQVALRKAQQAKPKHFNFQIKVVQLPDSILRIEDNKAVFAIALTAAKLGLVDLFDVGYVVLEQVSQRQKSTVFDSHRRMQLLHQRADGRTEAP